MVGRIGRGVESRTRGRESKERSREEQVGVSDVAVPPPNLGELFTNIELGSHWEPVLSLSVLSEYTAPAAPARPSIGAPQGAGRGSQTGENTDQAGLPNRMVTNENYKEALFGTYKVMGLNHARLRNSCTVRPHPPSFSRTGGEMFLPFNIKGICNMRCGKAYDHREHSDSDNKKLVAWCQEHYHK